MNVFPATAWVRRAPEDVAMDGAALARAQRWLDATADAKGYRFAVVKDGYLTTLDPIAWTGLGAPPARIQSC